MSDYIFKGDKFTDPSLKGQPCDAVRRPDGKCIVGRRGKVGMLVSFNGTLVVVNRRLLRKTK